MKVKKFIKKLKKLNPKQELYVAHNDNGPKLGEPYILKVYGGLEDVSYIPIIVSDLSSLNEEDENSFFLLKRYSNLEIDIDESTYSILEKVCEETSLSHDEIIQSIIVQKIIEEAMEKIRNRDV